MRSVTFASVPILCLFFTWSAISSTSPARGDHQSSTTPNYIQYKPLIDRYLRGEAISSTEKAIVVPLIQQIIFPVIPPNNPVIDRTGGPDNAGYRFIDNAEVAGPTFSWVTHTTGAARISDSAWTSTDDGYAGPYNIGFSFNFYGTNYTQFYAGTNGRIQFGSGDGSYYWNTTFPINPNPAGVYFWNRDMHVGYGNTVVRYETMANPTRCIITYDSLSVYGTGGSQRVSAQVVLYQDGRVLCQYRNYIGNPTFNCIGIQNLNGTTYLAYAQNGTQMPTAGTAILYYKLGPATNPIPANTAISVPTNTSLNWSAALAAVSYNVLFGTVNPPTTVVSNHQTGLSYSPTLAASTSYYWQVISLGDTAGTTSLAGPVWSFTTGTGTAPNAPGNGGISTTTPPTTSSITITWTDNSNNETGFPIYKMGVGDTNFSYVATADSNTTSYLITGLTPGNQYEFHVFAANTAARSLNFASTTGWTVPVTAGAPNLAVAGTGFTSIQITSLGNDNNSALCNYRIRETVSGKWITNAGTLDTSFAISRTANRAAWNNFIVNGLTSGQTYTFAVTAVNGAGVSAAQGPSSSIATNDLNHGGPDGYGYRYINSNAAGGPAFNWETITGTTPTLSFGGTDDGYYGPLNIGFTFNFYGTAYTQFYLGTNGYINFGTGTSNIPQFGTWPENGWPAGIYFWARDASTTYANAIKYQTLTNPNRLVIEVDGFAPVYWQNTQLLDWQIVLYSDGRILIQYRNYVGAVTSYGGNIGIQTANGTTYNLPYCTTTAQVPAANTAVLFYTLGQASNPIPSNSATNVPINPRLTWTRAAAATGYDVKFGTTNPPTTTVSVNQTDSSYTPPANLNINTQYYWQVIARNQASTNTGPVWSFTTGAGSAAVPPDSLWITGATIRSLQLGWRVPTTTATGFPIYRSQLDTGFVQDTIMNATARTFTDTMLTVNTRYNYRIFSTTGTIVSTAFAAVSGWTLATVPAAPTVTNVGITSAMITINNNPTLPNPTITQYAIMIGTRYVQSDGSLGTTAFWQPNSQWGNVWIHGLAATTAYIVAVKARNGAGVETALSGTTAFTTLNVMRLPFTQDFSATTFPPPDWTLLNPDNDITWTRYSSGGINSAMVEFSNYFSETSQTDFLYSPPISTDSCQFVRMTFDWYYYRSGNFFADTLEVDFSNDNGVTWQRFWWRAGNQTGDHDLQVNSNGDFMSPDPNITSWGHAEVYLPDSALNRRSIKLGFISHCQAQFSPNLYFTNIRLERAGSAVASGRVRRHDNSGVPGTTVTIHNLWTTTTDTNGRWRLSFPSGTYSINIHKPCMYPDITYPTYTFVTLPDSNVFNDSLFMPLVTANVTSLEFALAPGGTGTQTVNIRDVGDWPLIVSAAITYPTDGMDRMHPTPELPSEQGKTVMLSTGSNSSESYSQQITNKYGISKSSIRSTSLDKSSGNPVMIQLLPTKRINPQLPGIYELDTTGGPDAFGYRFIDSQERNGPVYSWITPSATASVVNGLTDDDHAGPFNIGFTFNFYGRNYTQFYAGSNGRIQFSTDENMDYDYSTWPPMYYTPGVYFWNDDMYVDSVTSIRYETLTNPTRLCVTYNNLTFLNGGGMISAQVILNQSGQITIQYGQQAGRPSINGCGIVGDSTHFLTYMNRPPAASSAVLFRRGPDFHYATVTPEQGTAAPGQVLELSVLAAVPDTIVIGTDLTATLIVSTNACSTFTIPITIHVVTNAAKDLASGIPIEYKLHQNYPNPFNPTTDIRFDLKQAGMTRLVVYNSLGQVVTQLVNNYLPAGYHSVQFRNNGLATGVYFYRLESGPFRAMKKMVMVK